MTTANCLTCEGTDSCHECGGTGKCREEEHDTLGSDCHCHGYGECPSCYGTGTCQECEGSYVERPLATGPSLEEEFDREVKALEEEYKEAGV